MKTILIIAVSLIGLLGLIIAALATIGSQLPVAHEATRSITLHKPADEIYKILRDVANSPSWRDGVKSVELLGEPNGKLNYREHGKQGDVTYEMTEDIPNQRIVTRIVDKDLGYSGSWTIVLTNEAGLTRVTITENGEVSNVLFRFMSRYVFGHTATIDDYLAALKKRTNEK